MYKWEITISKPDYLKANYNLDWVVLAKHDKTEGFIGFYSIANTVSDDDPDTDIAVADCVSLADARDKLIARTRSAFDGISNLNGLIPSLAALEKLDIGG